MADYIRDNLQIGKAIRNFRRQRNLTGFELGQRAGISQSKISKIETGYYSKPHSSEIEKIMNILEMPNTIRQQILAALELNRPEKSFRLHRTPYRQGSAYERERNASTIRIFSTIIPALLQTMVYRKAVLKALAIKEDAMTVYMTQTTKRQDLLWDPKRRYYLLFHENSLYTILGTADAHRTQLDRVERFIGIPHIKIGIIPLVAGNLALDYGPFVIYDDLMFVLLSSSCETDTHDPEEIVQGLKLFRELENLACYDDQAIQLVRKAADYFR